MPIFIELKHFYILFSEFKNKPLVKSAVENAFSNGDQKIARLQHDTCVPTLNIEHQ